MSTKPPLKHLLYIFSYTQLFSILDHFSNQKFDGIFLNWDNSLILEVIQNAFAYKNQLPFKNHIRDFIIGTECEKKQTPLITYDKKHFTWVNKIKIFTPEEYLLELSLKECKSNFKI